jgi:hypothetical protein
MCEFLSPFREDSMDIVCTFDFLKRNFEVEEMLFKHALVLFGFNFAAFVDVKH